MLWWRKNFTISYIFLKCSSAKRSNRRGYHVQHIKRRLSENPTFIIKLQARITTKTIHIQNTAKHSLSYINNLYRWLPFHLSRSISSACILNFDLNDLKIYYEFFRRVFFLSTFLSPQLFVCRQSPVSDGCCNACAIVCILKSFCSLFVINFTRLRMVY